MRAQPFVVQDIETGRYLGLDAMTTKDLQKAEVMRQGSGGWSKKFWRVIPVSVTIRALKRGGK